MLESAGYAPRPLGEQLLTECATEQAAVLALEEAVLQARTAQDDAGAFLPELWKFDETAGRSTAAWMETAGLAQPGRSPGGGRGSRLTQALGDLRRLTEQLRTRLQLMREPFTSDSLDSLIRSSRRASASAVSGRDLYAVLATTLVVGPERQAVWKAAIETQRRLGEEVLRLDRHGGASNPEATAEARVEEGNPLLARCASKWRWWDWRACRRGSSRRCNKRRAAPIGRPWRRWSGSCAWPGAACRRAAREDWNCGPSWPTSIATWIGRHPSCSRVPPRQGSTVGRRRTIVRGSRRARGIRRGDRIEQSASLASRRRDNGIARGARSEGGRGPAKAATASVCAGPGVAYLLAGGTRPAGRGRAQPAGRCMAGAGGNRTEDRSRARQGADAAGTAGAGVARRPAVPPPSAGPPEAAGAGDHRQHQRQGAEPGRDEHSPARRWSGKPITSTCATRSTRYGKS